ncbi:MAG: zf-HC2 domain-containing protein [Actinomycetota bacterium]|nr:zf-HC2 domain-containing protein [Actinomycetota bacterium]
MSSHLDDQQLSRLLDGDLSLAERAAALAHVSSCSACARRQAELVEVAATLRSYPRIAWTPHHTTSVLSELRTKAHDASQRRAFPAALLLTIVAAGLVLAALLAAPIGPQLASAVFDAVALMPPLRIASGQQALLTLLVIALVAPALVYPLARWR